MNVWEQRNTAKADVPRKDLVYNTDQLPTPSEYGVKLARMSLSSDFGADRPVLGASRSIDPKKQKSSSTSPERFSNHEQRSLKFKNRLKSNRQSIDAS